jgi:hypothetical protein
MGVLHFITRGYQILPMKRNFLVVTSAEFWSKWYLELRQIRSFLSIAADADGVYASFSSQRKCYTSDSKTRCVAAQGAISFVINDNNDYN